MASTAQRLAELEEYTFASWGFCRQARREPVEVIRPLLGQPFDRADARSLLVHLLVSADLPDDALQPAWKRALQTVLDLDTTYGWGSKQRRAKLEGVASEPDRLSAVQAVCASCPRVPLDYLAVLAIDASEASEDAFIPHVDRARAQESDFGDWLVRVRKFAREGSGIALLLARVQADREARGEESPALDIARMIGIPAKHPFWFRASLSSVSRSDGVPRIQAHVQIDSRSHHWHAIHVYDGGEGMLTPGSSSSFVAGNEPRDGLELGAPDPMQLPGWLVSVASRLDFEWAPDAHLSSGVRGKKRDRITAWLLSPSEP